MKNTTKQALAAIRAADETVDPRLALEALATLERGGAAPPEDRTLTEEQVRLSLPVFFFPACG